jgi:hypothetical protein
VLLSDGSESGSHALLVVRMWLVGREGRKGFFGARGGLLSSKDPTRKKQRHRERSRREREWKRRRGNKHNKIKQGREVPSHRIFSFFLHHRSPLSSLLDARPQ